MIDLSQTRLGNYYTSHRVECGDHFLPFLAFRGLFPCQLNFTFGLISINLISRFSLCQVDFIYHKLIVSYTYFRLKLVIFSPTGVLPITSYLKDFIPLEKFSDAKQIFLADSTRLIKSTILKVSCFCQIFLTNKIHFLKI